MADDPLLTGRNENAPFRAQIRVFVVVAIVVIVVGGIIYGLFAAFGGKSHGSTAPQSRARIALGSQPSRS